MPTHFFIDLSTAFIKTTPLTRLCFSSSASPVGSYVWSHLTSVLRSEDPAKQALIESLPDDIISRDFEAEFLKYSSYSDYTVSSGNDGFTSASN